MPRARRRRWRRGRAASAAYLASWCRILEQERATSNLDAEADLGPALDRDLEKVRRPAGDLGEERENRERLRPHRRVARTARDQFMGDVIMHVIERDIEAVRSRVLERPRNVRGLHEAEPQLDALEAVAELLDRKPLVERTPSP